MSCKTSMVISDSYSRENMGAREEHVYMYITQLCSLLLIVWVKSPILSAIRNKYNLGMIEIWWQSPSTYEWKILEHTWNWNVPQWLNPSIFILPRSVLLLLKNPTFICLCLAGATEATLIAGMSTFGPKFLESQFSLSASEAATLFGKETWFCNIFCFSPANTIGL